MRRLPASPGRAPAAVGWREGEYAALDFETTGLDYARDVVVSFGVVPVRGGRAIVGDSAHELVRPAVAPSPRSQTVHLLRPQDLADAPPIEVAREHLRSLLARRYVLAWFAEVEVRFLDRIFGGGVRTWRRRTIDVRNLAIAAEGKPTSLRAEPGFALGTVARRYGVPVANPHEAYDDALVTAQLFLVLVSKLPDLAAPTVRELLQLGRP